MVTVKLLVSQCQGHVAAATQMLCEGRHQELLFIGLCAIIVSVTSNINFVCLESRQPVVFVFSDCHRDRNAGMLHIKHFCDCLNRIKSTDYVSACGRGACEGAKLSALLGPPLG